MSEIQSNNKRIAKNTIFLYIRMGLVLLVSLFTTRIVLQALGVEDYGIYNVVSGFVAMFAFLNTSMSNGVQRFYNFSLGNSSEYAVKDVYNAALQIHIGLAILLIVILESFGLWYLHTQMVIPIERFTAASWVFQFAILSLLLLVIQIPYSAAIMAYEKMDYYAYLSIFDVCAKLIVAFLVKYSTSDKLILYGGLNLLISLISFTLYFAYAKIHFKEIRFEVGIRKNLFTSMLSFSGWNIFGAFSYMIKGQGLNVLLNFFFGPIVNAARGVSNMVMSAIQGFQSNIVIAFRPQLVQSYAQGDTDRVSYLFFSLSKISFILLSMLSIPVIVDVDYILHFWLGETIPDYTISFTVLVLLNMIISSLNTPVSQVVHATGKMKNYQLGTSIMICLILPISWVFLKLGYDAISVYWISLVISILNQLLCNLLLKKIYDYSLKKYFKEVIVPCVIYSLIVPIIPLLIKFLIDSSFIRLILICFSSVVMTLLVSYVVVFNEAEKKMLLNFLKLKKNA